MTAAALLLAPVACGLVLLVSGWAKAGDVSATRAAFISLRVPAPLRGPAVVRSLAYAELGLGLALLVTWGWALAVVGAVVAVLFVAYTFLVARVLRSGEAAYCNCFGILGSDRITAATVARNVVLVVLAALATAFGAAGSGIAPALRDLRGVDWWWPVMAALFAAAAVLVVSPGRASGPSAEPMTDEPVDYLRQPIPFGALVHADGTVVTLRTLAAKQPHLLLFMSLGCGTCHVVAEWLPGWAERLGPVQIDTVFTGPLEPLPPEMRPVGATPWRDPESAVTNMFVNARPSAVLLGADGLLAGGPVIGAREIEAFVEEIIGELSSSPPLPVADTEGKVEVDPHAGHGHGHGHDDHDEAEAPA